MGNGQSVGKTAARARSLPWLFGPEHPLQREREANASERVVETSDVETEGDCAGVIEDSIGVRRVADRRHRRRFLDESFGASAPRETPEAFQDRVFVLRRKIVALCPHEHGHAERRRRAQANPRVHDQVFADSLGERDFVAAGAEHDEALFGERSLQLLDGDRLHGAGFLGFERSACNAPRSGLLRQGIGASKLFLPFRGPKRLVFAYDAKSMKRKSLTPPLGTEMPAGEHAMRRGAARKEVSARVLLRSATGRTLEGWTLNLSTGGVRAVLEENVELGDRFFVSLEGAAEGEPPREGRVVWLQEEPDGAIVGIEFRGHHAGPSIVPPDERWVDPAGVSSEVFNADPVSATTARAESHSAELPSAEPQDTGAPAPKSK